MGQLPRLLSADASALAARGSGLGAYLAPFPGGWIPLGLLLLGRKGLVFFDLANRLPELLLERPHLVCLLFAELRPISTAFCGVDPPGFIQLLGREDGCEYLLMLLLQRPHPLFLLRWRKGG